MPLSALVKCLSFFFITYGKILIFLKSNNPVATWLRMILWHVCNQTWLTLKIVQLIRVEGLSCSFKTFKSRDYAWQITTNAQLDPHISTAATSLFHQVKFSKKLSTWTPKTSVAQSQLWCGNSSQIRLNHMENSFQILQPLHGHMEAIFSGLCIWTGP